MKKNLGNFIKTSFNRKNKILQFTVSNKSNHEQQVALIALVESRCPPFHYVKIFIKRKSWEELYNIQSLMMLLSYITNALRSTGKLHMKITWSEY